MDLKPWSWDWNEESYPTSSDFWVLVFFVPFFPLVRLILDRSIFESYLWMGNSVYVFHVKLCLFVVARRLISPTVDSKERRKTIVKFKESAWKCLCSSTVEALLLLVIYKEPWFKETSRFLLGPGDQIWPDQKLKLQMKVTYIFVGGFNVYTTFAWLFWETRRSDFKVIMLVHHIVTSFLIVLSHIFGFSRIGSVILALHEIDDLLLEIAKMCKYSSAEAMASFSFILFFLSWTTLRLIYYPFWILWNISCKSIKVKLDWTKKHWIEVGSPHMILYYVFNILLCCLHVVNIYWWILIVGVQTRTIRFVKGFEGRRYF